MSKQDPNSRPAVWNHKTFLERVAAAKSLLYWHGFLSEKESKKVQKRILKWVEKSRKEAE